MRYLHQISMFSFGRAKNRIWKTAGISQSPDLANPEDRGDYSQQEIAAGKIQPAVT